MATLPEKIQEAKIYLQKKVEGHFDIAVILGTGLGSFANSLEITAQIAFEEIPHFAKTTADHHAGQLVFGTLGGKKVAVMQGRYHFYEGFTLEQIAFPVRVLKAMGAETLVVSNIAGGVNPQFRIGDLMLITDHINLLGTNPLIGPNFEELGPRFPDMSEPYKRTHINRMQEIALEAKLPLQKGVYACMSGPALETAAEYRMLRTLGADAVGMSTVPEVITAVHAGMQVLGLSLITDVCLPDNLQPINVPEILATAAKAEPQIAQLIRGFVASL